jgi:hypothetical protein
VLVLLWLLVSFSEPGPRRDVLEWLGACAMYTALLALFFTLSNAARESDNTLALVAFGFLALVFGIGLIVSLVSTLRSRRGLGKSQSSATN